MAELAEQTGLPVATLKFYLREGLLPPGRSLSRTQAEYEEHHVARALLVRALTDIGGLDLATTQRVLAAVDNPQAQPVDVMQAASEALRPDAPPTPPEGAPRTRAWLARQGWEVGCDSPEIAVLEAAWAACDIAGIGLDEERMSAYADAVGRVADIDVGTVPDDPAAAVRQVVLGTVLLDPVLASLRRLAQQHAAAAGARRAAAR